MRNKRKDRITKLNAGRSIIGFFLIWWQSFITHQFALLFLSFEIRPSLCEDCRTTVWYFWGFGSINSYLGLYILRLENMKLSSDSGKQQTSLKQRVRRPNFREIKREFFYVPTIYKREDRIANRYLKSCQNFTSL